MFREWHEEEHKFYWVAKDWAGKTIVVFGWIAFITWTFSFVVGFLGALGA